MRRIKLSKKSAVGSSYHDTFVQVTPNQIKEVYGEGSESDGYKVAWEWIFEDEKGNIFTVYNYKGTSLYDPELSSPEELQDTEMEFHVGSNSPELEMAFVKLFIKSLKL